MCPPNPPLSISDMAIDTATQATHPGPSCPHTATQIVSPTGPITTTPGPSTVVTFRQPGHKTTITAGQSMATVAATSQPQFMRFNWTVQEVTQLDELRAQGLSWSQISRYFVGKSGNACRKRHERHKRTTTPATTLTASQAQRFTSMLASVNYSNMTPAQILQMHHQFLHAVREVPRLR